MSSKIYAHVTQHHRYSSYLFKNSDPNHNYLDVVLNFVFFLVDGDSQDIKVRC